MTEVRQYWWDSLPPLEPEKARTCPRCGCAQFTAEQTAYGVKLACFRCPTYIGIYVIG